MRLRRSLYARPAIVRGEQCAGAPLIQNDHACSDRLYEPHASGGRSSSIYWCWLQAGRDRPGNDWRVKPDEELCEDCSELHAQGSHLLAGATGFPGRSSPCRPGSRPWSSAADVHCVRCSTCRPGRSRPARSGYQRGHGVDGCLQAPLLTLQPRHRSNSRARKNTASSISSVNFLVFVFCWLTW